MIPTNLSLRSQIQIALVNPPWFTSPIPNNRNSNVPHKRFCPHSSSILAGSLERVYPDRAFSLPRVPNGNISIWHFQIMTSCTHPPDVFSCQQCALYETSFCPVFFETALWGCEGRYTFLLLFPSQYLWVLSPFCTCQKFPPLASFSHVDSFITFHIAGGVYVIAL